MSDATPLPPRPNLDQYRKLAKDFQRACKSQGPSAVREWAARWLEALARLRGTEVTDDVRRGVAREAERVEQRWKRLQHKHPERAQCRLADAQFFLAREHGFVSWPKFSAHIEELTRPDSPVSSFEAAADAIVNGDAVALGELLRTHPQLVHDRSTRDHHSTLLHYVSANGVEDFRQKTPPNILDMTRMLLDAGADVNAESDAYAGGSTTLGLAATSIHPEQAGLQIPLLELLLDRGSRLDQPAAAGNWHSVVAGCLANGQPEAAEYLLSRGAPLDLQSASAIGSLSFVQSCFDEQGRLKPPANERQLKSAFVYACGYGRDHVVRFLLDRGVDPRTDPEVRSSLHWAVYSGNVGVIRLLLQAGADVNLKHERDQVRPLEVSLVAWSKCADDAEREGFYDVVRLLVEHGASLDPEWFRQDERKQELAERVRSDPRMSAALNLPVGFRRKIETSG